ncbi:hypothetical protein BC829DRAFT_415415 [Chytridium lagenaria]|nr:hypothetical protein BC829DRAFT_415415 [Chytridium lagenaria]
MTPIRPSWEQNISRAESDASGGGEGEVLRVRVNGMPAARAIATKQIGYHVMAHIKPKGAVTMEGMVAEGVQGSLAGAEGTEESKPNIRGVGSRKRTEEGGVTRETNNVSVSLNDSPMKDKGKPVQGQGRQHNGGKDENIAVRIEEGGSDGQTRGMQRQRDPLQNKPQGPPMPEEEWRVQIAGHRNPLQNEPQYSPEQPVNQRQRQKQRNAEYWEGVVRRAYKSF